MTKHHFRASTTLRVATVGLLAAVIGLSTSLSGQTEPLRPLHSGEKVYLLRGFTNVLSPITPSPPPLQAKHCKIAKAGE
jgi:hypothetical protein